MSNTKPDEKNHILSLKDAKTASVQEAEAILNFCFEICFNLSFNRNLSGATQRSANEATYAVLAARRSAAIQDEEEKENHTEDFPA